MTATEEQFYAYTRGTLQITTQPCRLPTVPKKTAFFKVHLTETPTGFSALNKEGSEGYLPVPRTPPPLGVISKLKEPIFPTTSVHCKHPAPRQTPEKSSVELFTTKYFSHISLIDEDGIYTFS